MVTHSELVKLGQISQSQLGLTEEQLIAFVKAGAVRAYKAGAENRSGENVEAEFNAESQELRLIVRKKVVTTVTDEHTECTESDGKAEVGQMANIEVMDKDTYEAIDAAIASMKKLIHSQWKKENSLLVKTKFQEYKDKCLMGTVIDVESEHVVVDLLGVQGLLPINEQIQGEKYAAGDELVVLAKELKQVGDVNELIVSRIDPAIVSYVMRANIPEVDLGSIEIKRVARIPGKRARVAVWSKDFAPTERCAKRASKVSSALGNEQVDFVEWYPDIKAFIASSVKAEVRDVHLIESEKQALVEVFNDSPEVSSMPQHDLLELVQTLTGFKVDVKLVERTESSELPGV
jgi:transcription termination/antitermination protein NusA